ncbi:MAG: 3-hydroxyacyl-CoA dehydrogenase NAD-binding domain-containing protein [Gemmatimonadetes bacterium]|nr:3-hydroxyacyl-CoA dehydrogenase NAD-binding domain-containing protein [Gemmatimonadota bacterium]MDA1103262.1 3-hydroxyacyl-CoA dehydrogenase NAD-binding domain-containing protein [Gemmatimonadota bacterium]
MTPKVNPTFEIDSDRIGWITFDDVDRPVNVLTEPVMVRFGEALTEALTACREARARVVVVRSGKPSSFIAGADIEQIGSVEDPVVAERQIRMGQAVYDQLAALPVPTVAAIHGLCVGGGVEMSLACDRRVLSDSPKTSMSLPEVQLGILPAWGGTTRLPRVIGLRAALDLLLTGKRVDAKKALRIGLASEVVPAELFTDKVRAFALSLAKNADHGAGPRPKLSERLLGGTGLGRRVVLAMARKKVMTTTGGHYPAPLRILDVLGENLGRSVEESLLAESRAAAELVVSPVCKNLLHVFHMREAARKGTGLPLQASGDVEALPVDTLGVLGAGVMGGGIGQLAAHRDIRVYMKDIQHEAVTGGLKHARSLFDRAVKRRRMSRREAAQHMERIAGGLDYHGLANADVVIEAIVEKMAVKKAVLRETEGYVSADCVLATNTSSLSVSEMSEALERPDRFCGMHFFNPVDRMPLVEVIRGTSTTDRTTATIYALALRLGKVPVVVGDGPGFLVNRILGPYMNEAGHLLGEGASIADIDRVARVFGMPMGPLRLIDEVGIDVSGHAGASLHKGLGARLAPAPALLALAQTGRLGRKGGVGFYTYEKGREKGIDPSIYTALGAVLQPLRPFTDKEIRHRLIVAMINEAARVLEDGIVGSARDVDLAMIMGTGFPPFRGGLLRFADTLHPRGLLDIVRVLHQAHGDRFEPAPVLERLATKDEAFYRAFPTPRSAA